jgi:peptidoglycan/LPS O-acetylase OafA/YrhL
MTTAAIHSEGPGTPPPLNLSARIPELDGIRGIAIGMVLIAHHLAVVTVPGSALAYALVPLRLMGSGVDLFFVLSGFLIGGILMEARPSSNYFRVFYTRRFFRIVPIYAVLLLSAAFVWYLVDSGHIRGFDEIFVGRLSWWYFVTFLQNIGMSIHNVWGTFPLGVTWSLAVEEQFYLTLPLLIRFLDRRALVRFILFAIVGAPLLRAFFFHHDPTNLFTWYTLMPCRADSLLVGVLGAILLREPRWRDWLLDHRRFTPLVLGFLLVGVAFLGWRAPKDHWYMVTIGATQLALTYLAFLLYALLYRDSWISRCLRWNWLCGLGVIAYGTYLFHEFFLGMFFQRTPWIYSWRDVGVSMFSMAVTILVCRLSWLYFEKPLVKIGHRTGYQFGATRLAKTMAAPVEGG